MLFIGLSKQAAGVGRVSRKGRDMNDGEAFLATGDVCRLIAGGQVETFSTAEDAIRAKRLCEASYYASEIALIRKFHSLLQID